MIPPKVKPIIIIDKQNGNAFAIIGAVNKALKRAGADLEYINKYKKEAMAGDYNNLLCITMKYVEFN